MRFVSIFKLKKESKMQDKNYDLAEKFIIAISAIAMIWVFGFVIWDKDPMEQLQENKTEQVVQQKKSTAEHEKEIIELAKIIWCEARTSKKAMTMVASVIFNRSKEKTIEDYHKEATREKQFSCWVDGDIVAQTNRAKDKKAFVEALHIATKMATREFSPITNANHYFAYKKVSKPKWAKKMEVVAIYEGHVYLTD